MIPAPPRNLAEFLRKQALFWVVAASSLLPAQLTIAADIGSGLLFPKGTNLVSLISISESALGSSEQQLMIATLQGLVARSSTQQIYIDSSTYARWRTYLTSAYGISQSTQTDPWALLTQFRNRVSGYVLYNYANTNSRNAATSLCGPLNAIAVDVTLESAVRGRGITNLLADVRAYNEATVRANYPGLFNPNLAIEQDEFFRTQLRDYAAMANAFIFADGNSAFRASVLAELSPDAALLGWGQGGEDSFIGPASDKGVFMVPSDHARNLSVLSSVRTPPAQQRTDNDRQLETNVHYVAFLVTDGDNLQWALGDFPDYYNHPARGSFSMGWALPPALADIAPAALHWFYHNASNGLAKDFFVAGPSGLGYMYPSRYPLAELERHTRRFNDFAAFTDLRIAQIIDFNSFNRVDLWSRYTAEPNIDAVIYIEYSRYDSRNGAMAWQNGKPVFAPRKMLWEGLSGADEASVTSALNNAARDPYTASGYSLVMVHVWSKDLGNVQTVVNGLASHVRVVTPGELVRLMKGNIAGKLTFDFQDGAQGWTGATSGKPSDRADWSAGFLRLTGSDSGISDSTPNATFTRLISLPLNVSNLRFDTRALGPGLLRVRVRPANGSFATLVDWSALPDQNWHTVLFPLDSFAGQEVTIYLEQNDAGLAADSTRFVDNIQIEKLGIADVVYPEADTYVRNGAFADTNYGPETALVTSTGADTQQAFLRFALSNISGAVLSATLRLTPLGSPNGATNALFLVSENDWEENSVTWNSQPILGTELLTWSPAPGVAAELPLTTVVQNALTNDGQITLGLIARGANVSFSSREAHHLYAPRLLVITSNTPPSIAPIPDQTISRNGSITIPFSINDPETPAHQLRVSAFSSNTTLLPESGISTGGAGSERSLTLTPASNRLGTAIIQVSVNDGVLSSTASFDLTVTGSNSPPVSVQFTSPPNGAMYFIPAMIPLAVTVNDPDGNISRVDYLLGNSIILSSTTPPFSAVWSNVPPGTFLLRAKATDDGGLAVTSVLRQVTVQNAPATLVPAGAVWKYYDQKTDLGTAWRETNYNDSAWASGPAKLGFGDSATTQVNSDSTRVTTYFRHRFVATNATEITNLAFSLMRDDGGVVYLNGAEVWRSNMPGGTINYLTLASSSISGAEETTWFTNRTGNFQVRNGTNIIAVEIHQGSNDSSDLGFNFALQAQTRAATPLPIPLTTSQTATNVVLKWSGDSYWNLYSSPTLGPTSVWTRVNIPFPPSGGTVTAAISPTHEIQFFRLSRP